jgi:undecaprenyl-diphosphatase
LSVVALRLLLALGFAVAFAAITWGVVTRPRTLARLDERVMATIARRRTKTFDGIAGPLSMLATQEPLTLQGLIAFLMLIVTIGGPALAHFIVVSVGSGILSEVVKRVVRRPRPPGPHLIRWIRGYSYPSGDLLTASAIYTTIALIVSPHLPDRLAAATMFTIVGALLALLGTCRVYAAVHYPSDVVGGACLGLAWALFVSAWFV